MPNRNAEYQRKWYLANKDVHDARVARNNKRLRIERRTWFGEYKEQLSCSICGESESVCLDFHHRDSEEKFKEVSRMVGDYSIETTKLEIDKCDVLCANCHRKRHAGLV